MTRLEALERKYKEMNIDEMTLAELKQARGNMRGWMDAVMDENGARGVVEIDGTERLPSLYDLAAVERKLKQVETEIAWRERGEALRLHKNQEAQISEMRRVGNLMADHLNALGISRHDREWADASNPIPDESDLLKGVPFVSLSNAEIEAMTPEHPLYKLVKGDRKCKDE